LSENQISARYRYIEYPDFGFGKISYNILISAGFQGCQLLRFIAELKASIQYPNQELKISSIFLAVNF